MQKLVLVVVLLMFFGAVLPAAAQGNNAAELPACTEAEMTILNETLTVIQDGYTEISEIGADGAPENLTAATIGYDQLSTGYWEQVFPILPECMESREVSYTIGLILDESLIATAMARLAIYEQEYGDAEIAAGLSEYALARAGSLQASVESYFTMIAEDGIQADEPLPACTEADWNSEEVAAFQEIALSYQDLGLRTQEAVGLEGLAPLTLEYAGMSSTFWNEHYPTLPACAEIDDLAFNTGLVLDDSLIVILFGQLSQYEAEYGSEEVSQLYADSAAARAEALTASVEALFGEIEAE